MKKYIFLVSIAVLFLVSCTDSREENSKSQSSNTAPTYLNPQKYSNTSAPKLASLPIATVYANQRANEIDRQLIQQGKKPLHEHPLQMDWEVQSSRNIYSSGSKGNNGFNIYQGNDEEQDGETHTATVEYYNPITGFSNTYELVVNVEDGKVTQINFPDGGWLDDSHITPGELENGHAHITGEDGKTYDVEINDDAYQDEEGE